MNDIIQLDDTGRVLNDDVAFLKALAGEYQYILFGDMAHNELPIDLLMAKPETAEGLSDGGVTQLHMESFDSNQKISDPINADLEGFVAGLKAGDADAIKLRDGFAEQRVSCWNKSTGDAEQVIALAKDTIMNLSANGITTHHSDSSEAINEVMKNFGFTAEERRMYWAVTVAMNAGKDTDVYELKNQCSRNRDEISPEMKYQVDRFVEAVGMFEEAKETHAEIKAAIAEGNIDKAE